MYVSFQELATRVSHRNTGKACNDPVAEQLLARISNDENLHMIFYRDVSAAGLDIAPNMAIQSVYRIPEELQDAGFTVLGVPPQGRHHRDGRVYDPRIHLEDVVAGAQEVANLRARRLHRRGRPPARRTRQAHRGTRRHLRQVRGSQRTQARPRRQARREARRQGGSCGAST